MGKDQRGKKHGLDLRRNREQKKLERQLFTQPPKPTKKHKGQR